jgi:DNA-binding transcriptional LysR family regulator
MPLPQPVPDLISLDLLASVAALGSIRQAAMAHGISQPAASTRLRALEGTLGVELLVRSSGGAQLTPAGRVVVGWSEQVLGDVRSLLTATAALRHERRTQVHVAASMTVAEYLAPEWLVRLATLDPQLHVALDMANSEQVAELVRDGRVDLGFVEGASRVIGLRSQVLLDDELVLVVGPHHRWASRRSDVTAAELAATPQVLREAGSGTREVLEEWLGASGLVATAVVELGSTTAIKRAVESGVAPAVLSRLAVHADVRDGRLVAVPIAGGGPTRTIRALWSASAPLSAAAKRVLAQIHEATSER